MKEKDILFIYQMIINTHKTASKFVLVILYDDESIYMFQRINVNKLMYLKYQVVCEKMEPEETGKEAVQRETVEETNLVIKNDHLFYLTNDSTFNSNIYYAKLKELKISERTEPQNIRSWLYYSWITWYNMAIRKQTTPILTTFKDIIDNMMRMF